MSSTYAIIDNQPQWQVDDGHGIVWTLCMTPAPHTVYEFIGEHRELPQDYLDALIQTGEYGDRAQCENRRCQEWVGSLLEEHPDTGADHVRFYPYVLWSLDGVAPPIILCADCGSRRIKTHPGARSLLPAP